MTQIKKVNKEELIKKGMEKIEEFKIENEIREIIKEEFKKIDGKKITKRVATNIENALNKKINEGFVVYYDKNNMGNYTITIWNPNIKYINYDNKSPYIINHRDLEADKTYNHEKFINEQGRFSDCNEQISEIEKDLELIKNSNIIEEYNKACDIIKSTKKSLKRLGRGL